MIDIVIEILRAIIVGIILIAFLRVRPQKSISTIIGWRYIVVGFALLFFGVIIDITDNFQDLNRFFVIGDTQVQSFLEKVIGYLFGFIFIAYGIWRWLPKVAEHSELKDREIEVSQERLKVLHATMRTVQDIVNNFLGNITLFRLKAEKANALDPEVLAKMDSIIKDTAEKIKKLGDLNETPEKQMAGGTRIDYERSASQENT